MNWAILSIGSCDVLKNLHLSAIPMRIGEKCADNTSFSSLYDLLFGRSGEMILLKLYMCQSPLRL